MAETEKSKGRETHGEDEEKLEPRQETFQCQ